MRTAEPLGGFVGRTVERFMERPLRSIFVGILAVLLLSLAGYGAWRGFHLIVQRAVAERLDTFSTSLTLPYGTFETRTMTLRETDVIVSVARPLEFRLPDSDVMTSEFNGISAQRTQEDNAVWQFDCRFKGLLGVTGTWEVRLGYPDAAPHAPEDIPDVHDRLGCR